MKPMSLKVVFFLTLVALASSAFSEPVTDHENEGLDLIDFDDFPEGTSVTDQYQDLGVLFAGNGVTEEIGEKTLFVGASLPNVLSFGGFSPGPGEGLGCNIDFTAEMIAPRNTSADLRVFAVATIGDIGLFQLVGRDSDGNVVDQDEFQITGSLEFGLDIFSLGVSDPRIASIEIQSEDACAVIDDLVIGSFLFIDAFEGGDTLAWSNTVR